MRVARLTLQTPKLWLVGVATDRDARYACLCFFSCFPVFFCLRFFSFFPVFFAGTKKKKPKPWILKVALRPSGVLLVVLKILIRESLYSTWHQIKNRERKGPSRGIIQKCAPHERSPCAPKFEERSHEETLHQERCARKAAWDFAKKNIYKLKNSDKATFYIPGEVKGMSTPRASKRPEEREFVVDSRASTHMMSKKKD